MKIKEIHIYGYGKLENLKINNLSDFIVFYGENEAGKTTIMSFIHSVLFGFPTRQQTELRYEPIQGAKYGGQLIVEFEEKGRVVIERVKGKASGDVSVLLEDGTAGGEDLLKRLLSRIDKALYQSIFSFNLHGLQNVHHLKSEDLGKFLFSTGTVGSERLFVVENFLRKELEVRFKPNGKKPSINEKLTELKEIYNNLKKAEQQNEQYGALLRHKETLQNEILKGQNDRSSLQRKLHQLEEWKKITPLVKERKVLEKDLEGLEGVVFPIDGLARLEQLYQMMKPVEGQIKALQEKQDKLIKDIDDNSPDKGIIEKESDIQAAPRKLFLYESLKEEEGEWRSKLKKCKEDIEDLQERLHLPLTDERLQKCNTSIFMKEKTAEAQRKQVRLKERKQELDDLFSEEGDLLERNEDKIRQLKRQLLSSQEREAKKERLSKIGNKESVEKELELIQDKLKLLNSAAVKEQEQVKQSRIQTVFFGFLFMLLLSFGIWSSQWLVALLGGMGVIYFFFLIYKSKNSKQGLVIRKDIQDLKDKEKALLEELSNITTTETALLQEQLKKDEELQEQLKVLKIKWEQQKEQYEKVIQAFESWEKESFEHNKQLLIMGSELFLPDEIALNHIHDAFLLVVKLKEGLREKNHIQEQIEIRETKLRRIKTDLTDLTKQFFNEETLTFHEAVTSLNNRLKDELANQIKYEEKLEKQQDTKEQLFELTREYDHLLKEKKSLLYLAQAENEEEYRLKAKEAEKRDETLKRNEDITRQIQLSSLREKEINQFLEIADLEDEIEQTAYHISDLDNTIREAQEQLADIKHKITRLEEGGAYTELLHTFMQKKSELEIEAWEWARLALAKDALKKTVAHFKDEHLPNMLLKAEEYLSFLTDGNYKRIIPKDDSNGFLIERKDHILFEANELSQATTEQVYVALRLALASTIYRKQHFPIIIDDSFVNFDHIRTGKVIQLLRDIKGNQILFFTCHQHLLPYFKDEQILMMGKRKGDAVSSLGAKVKIDIQ